MAKQQASCQAVPPDVETIGQLMDAIRENRTPIVSIPIKLGSGSLAQRIREGKASQADRTGGRLHLPFGGFRPIRPDESERHTLRRRRHVFLSWRVQAWPHNGSTG